jgi:hypothetical protein
LRVRGFESNPSQVPARAVADGLNDQGIPLFAQQHDLGHGEQAPTQACGHY